MALYSSPKPGVSAEEKVVTLHRPSLTTTEMINGIRIARIDNPRDVERVVDVYMRPLAVPMQYRASRGQIEYFRASNSVGNDIAFIVASTGSKVIEMVYPLKENLTMTKAMGLLREAVEAKGYSFAKALTPTVVDMHGVSWSVGQLPETLELNEEWWMADAGVIEMPRHLVSTSGVSINASIIRKQAQSLRIGGHLNMSFSEIGILGGDTVVEGHFLAIDSGLTGIEDGARFEGFANLSGSRMEWLSRRVSFGSHIDLGNSALRETDEGITVNGKFRIENTPIERMGAGLTVKSDFYCPGSKLKGLPEDSYFEGDVFTDNPDLIIPASTHILGRVLLLSGPGYEPVNSSYFSRA